MRTLNMLFAGLLTAFALAVATPASAGGWDRGDDYGYGTVYVHHHVYAPPRHVHVMAYEHPGYHAYYGHRPYAYGVYWRQPAFYRSYYPVRSVYPVRHHHRRPHYLK